MKAIQLVGIGRPLEERDVPVPSLGPADVLVRVKAAGLCRSDVHYRAGTSPAGPLPLTLGHEVAGVVEAVGAAASGPRPGDRVCLHYLVACGECEGCRRHGEQFCARGRMIGKHRDGGFAEFIAVPARNVFRLPDEVPFAHGAVMMCSSATSLHALRKGRLQPGESVAVFGAGGLGLSAVQLARALGAAAVYAADIHPRKLALAEALGAVPVDAAREDPVAAIRRLSGGGVDVALELVGLPLTMRQAFEALAPLGRAVLVGITPEALTIAPYTELINREAEVIGASDHLASDIPALLEMARGRALDLSRVVTRRLPLQAAAVNQAMDDLERFGVEARAVVMTD